VWFDIERSDDGRHSVGHTKCYVKVLVPFREDLPGACYQVKIHSAQRFHIEGELQELVSLPNNKTLVALQDRSRAQANKQQRANKAVPKQSMPVLEHGEDYGDHDKDQNSSNNGGKNKQIKNVQHVWKVAAIGLAMFGIAWFAHQRR
jgi:hypothetical protein